MIGIGHPTKIKELAQYIYYNQVVGLGIHHSHEVGPEHSQTGNFLGIKGDKPADRLTESQTSQSVKQTSAAPLVAESYPVAFQLLLLEASLHFRHEDNR